MIAKLESFIKECSQWSKETFAEKDRRVIIIQQLVNSAKNLIKVMNDFDEKEDENELADIIRVMLDVYKGYSDCFIWFLIALNHMSIDFKSLVILTEDRLEDNKKCNWGITDDGDFIRIQ